MTAPVETRQPTATQLAQLVALLRAQQIIREQMTQAALAAATVPLRAFTGWWNPEATAAMVERILRLVRPAQLRAARATDVFAARAMSVLSGRTVQPVGAVDVTKLRRKMSDALVQELVAGTRTPAWLELGDTVDGPNGAINQPVDLVVADDPRTGFADPGDAYGRVFDSYRFNVVARGDSPDLAAQKAVVRIGAVAQTDITLAVREQYRESFDRDRVQGWRRILRPELSETGPCGLCVVAADRTYRRGDLLPLHDRCCCDVLPVVDGLDPGLKLNFDDLERLYAAAGTTSGRRQGTHAPGLKAIRVALAEHGELGPVLVDAGQHHRGPVEAAKPRHPDPRVRAEAELASLEPTLARLEQRAAAGESVDKPLSWQRNRVAELRALLRT